MDGYAIHSADIPTAGRIAELDVIGTALAGVPFTDSCPRGTAVRIMTGAVMPEPMDTVVMQERVERDNDTIRINDDNQAGQNTRLAGEDLQPGTTVLSAGRPVTTR